MLDGRRWMTATTTEYYHYQHFYRVEQLVYSNMCHPSSSLQHTIVRSHNDGRHKNMKYLKFYDKALIYHKLHHICPCGKIFSSSTFLPEYLIFEILPRLLLTPVCCSASAERRCSMSVAGKRIDPGMRSVTTGFPMQR